MKTEEYYQIQADQQVSNCCPICERVNCYCPTVRFLVKWEGKARHENEFHDQFSAELFMLMLPANARARLYVDGKPVQHGFWMPLDAWRAE
jgi:hypothetical protein